MGIAARGYDGVRSSASSVAPPALVPGRSKELLATPDDQRPAASRRGETERGIARIRLPCGRVRAHCGCGGRGSDRAGGAVSVCRFDSCGAALHSRSRPLRVNRNALSGAARPRAGACFEARRRMDRICSGSSGLTLGHPLSCRRSDEAAWFGEEPPQRPPYSRQSGSSGGALARDLCPRRKEYGTAMQARRGQVIDSIGNIVCDGCGGGHRFLRGTGAARPRRFRAFEKRGVRSLRRSPGTYVGVLVAARC